ncbi:MAG: hypothetical protein IRZ16_07860 [Myxococcaceae bacterium]|nr:hypothetical protein [Myxococcaceae bacterium]
MELRSGRTGCLQWAVAFVAAPGEQSCGDGWLVRADEATTFVAVVDGLGHGDSARAAADRALASIDRAPGGPADKVKAAHETLLRLRGAAVGVMAVRPDTGAVRWCGVGNVEAAVEDTREAPRRWRRLFLQSGLVGHRLPVLREASSHVDAGGLIVVSTDGVRAEFLDDLGATGDLNALTERIVSGHRRDADDALVFVGRFEGGVR